MGSLYSSWDWNNSMPYEHHAWIVFAAMYQKENRFRDQISLELPLYLLLHSIMPLLEKVTQNKMAFFCRNSHSEAPVCLSSQSSQHRPKFTIQCLCKREFSSLSSEQTGSCVALRDALHSGLPFRVLQGSLPPLSSPQRRFRSWKSEVYLLQLIRLKELSISLVMGVCCERSM